MAATWEAIEALGTWATAVAAAVGFIFIQRQISQAERTIRGSTHERLTAESFEVLRFLASVPNSYAYFYEGKELGETDTNREFILYATEALANYVEHVVAEKPNMTDVDWRVWSRFIDDTFRRAPVVRKHVEQHCKWYSPELLEMIKAATTNRDAQAHDNEKHIAMT
jgi:hypothetical protein